jgi:DNA-binding MarR family transcriptional regulator
MGKGVFGRLQSELDAREKAAGLSMADILALPDELRRLVNWILRQEEVSLQQLAAQMGHDEATTQTMIADLVEQGLVREMNLKGVQRYRVRLAPKKQRVLPADLWRALDQKIEQHGE